MGEIAGIYRFVVEGDDAERIYEIFKKSYFVESNMQPYKDCNVQVEFSYEDRYFVRPPKTEWELEMEQRMNERICQSSDDDLPF